MKSIDLAGAWRLHRAFDKGIISRECRPGDTHSALLAAGRIPGPLLGSQRAGRAVGRPRRLGVRADLRGRPEDFHRGHWIELSFEGLDTMAEVFAEREEDRQRRQHVRALALRREEAPRSRARTRCGSSSRPRRMRPLAEAKKLPYPVPAHQVIPCSRRIATWSARSSATRAGTGVPASWWRASPGASSLRRVVRMSASTTCTPSRSIPGGNASCASSAECEAARAGEYALEVSIGAAIGLENACALPAGRTGPPWMSP